MKFLLVVLWLTPIQQEQYVRVYAEPAQCETDAQSMADTVHAATNTQLLISKCYPIAPGMLEAVGA